MTREEGGREGGREGVQTDDIYRFKQGNGSK